MVEPLVAQTSPSKGPKDEVIAHLNKTIFVSGETLHFFVSALLDQKNSPSKIAYAELISRDGEALAQEIIPLNNGSNRGYLEIPENLVSDHYLIRIYTRMTPIDDTEKGPFHQFITVVNPKKPPLREVRQTDPSKNTGIINPSTQNLITLGRNKVNAKDSVQFTLSKTGGTFLGLSVSLQNPFLIGPLSKPFYRSIYQSGQIEHRPLPEIYGHIIKGKKLDENFSEEETYFLSAHGKQSMLFTAKANERGEVYFDLGPFQDYNFLIAQSSNWQSAFNFIIEYPFLETSFDSDFQFPELVLDENNREFLQNLVLSKESNRYLEPDEIKSCHEIVTGFSADHSYLLDDYNRFEDIATTLREYVPQVFVRRQDKKLIYRVFNTPYNVLYKDLPLMLIDAMPVFDSDALGNFDPTKMKKLDVVARDFYINQDVFSGVISFTSFENDFGGFPLPNNALYISYKGPQKARIPVLPRPAKLNDRFYPDFRSVLYWQPEVVPPSDQKIGFKASATEGQFVIRASYVSHEGQLVTDEKTFEVGPSAPMGMRD